MEEFNLCGRGAERLAEEVLREVKKRLGLEAGRYHGRKTAVVLGALSAEEDALLREFSRLSSNPEEGADLVIVAQLSLKTLAQTALGIAQDSWSETILRSLLLGKRVYLLESGLEYRSYRETAHKTLYRQYQDYEERLCRLGAEIIGSILDIASGETQLPELKTNEFIDLTEVRLLGEADLRKIRGQKSKSILVNKKTLITPLAEDYITTHGLVVHRRREGSGEGIGNR